MRADDPEKAVHGAQAFDVHLALGPGREVDEVVEGEMPMLAEPPVPQAPQALDARGLVAGEKETVADARDGGQVLVERILHVSQRPPVGKGEIDLSEEFSMAVVGHGRSLLWR